MNSKAIYTVVENITHEALEVLGNSINPIDMEKVNTLVRLGDSEKLAVVTVIEEIEREAFIKTTTSDEWKQVRGTIIEFMAFCYDRGNVKFLPSRVSENLTIWTNGKNTGELLVNEI